MDIKLERTKFEDGAILFLDHGVVGAGRKPVEWSIADSVQAGDGTLADAQRMCFYVLADEFPAQPDEVIVKVSWVQFDRRPRR